MQLSVVLADKVDTTILGYALPDAGAGAIDHRVSEREQAVLSDPADELDAGLSGGAGGGEPGGIPRLDGPRPAQVRWHAIPGRAGPAGRRSWPGSTPRHS